MSKYGVYIADDDDMFLMEQNEVFDYLQLNSKVCQSYSVHTDGETVSVYEPSAGANGKLSEMSVGDFFYGFEEDGIMIRKISEWKRP